MKTKTKTILLSATAVIALTLLVVINSTHVFDDRELPNLVTELKVDDAFPKVLKNFEEDTGRFPSTEEGFEALFVNPGIEGWNGPYLKNKDSLLDGWKKIKEGQFLILDRAI